ncbi:molybdopterin-dependent oxidoreductase [Francisellaceae bacterium]|nr:molybdopterin-dependent oxidoreductase [Francisellaceae bacterium]
MSDIHKLREKILAKLKKQKLKEEETQKEMAFFDKIVSRKDYIKGAGKLGMLGLLADMAIKPSAWAAESEKLEKKMNLADFKDIALPSDVEKQNVVTFLLNGDKVQIVDPSPRFTLATYLREVAGYTGTKVSCTQGACGACSVILSENTKTGIEHRTINSCLRPVVLCDGTAITTVEGLGNTQDGLDLIQEKIAKHNGTQCGFCTPGFVVAMRGYLENHPTPTKLELDDIFSGNLCRCTGYRTICNAAHTFANDQQGPTPMDCSAKGVSDVKFTGQITPLQDSFSIEKPIKNPCFVKDGHKLYKPDSISTALKIYNQEAKNYNANELLYVMGCSSFGIFRDSRPQVAISLSELNELNEIKLKDNVLTIGAAVPVEKISAYAEEQINLIPDEQSTGLKAMIKNVKAIAGIQVRSVSTLAGSVMLAHKHAKTGIPFVSDFVTILATLNATVIVASAEFISQKEYDVLDIVNNANLPKDLIILYFKIPLSQQGQFIRTFRVARKPQMSHPMINAGINCLTDSNGQVSQEGLRIVIAGLNHANQRLTETEKALSGANINNLSPVIKICQSEIKKNTLDLLGYQREGLSVEYRSNLAIGIIYKALLELVEFKKPGKVNAAILSAITEPKSKPISGSYVYDRDTTQLPENELMVKYESFAQATGEVEYTDDTPLGHGGSYAAVVGSAQANSNFKYKAPLTKIEEEVRNKFPGFQTIVTDNDIPGDHLFGVAHDEPVLYKDYAPHHGARIAVVVADTPWTAGKAARYIENECIEYTSLGKPVITTQEAVENGQVLPKVYNDFLPTHLIKDGSNLDLFDKSKPLPSGYHRISGVMETGFQAHFGMEMRAAIATPGKYGSMHILNGTQWPAGEQNSTAKVLGVPLNKVTLEVNQLGGGFGGGHHHSCQFAVMAALAARKVKRQVKIQSTREQNMQLIGKRHPFQGEYTIVYKDDGKIVGLDVTFNANGGCTTDVSYQVLGLARLHGDHCYKLDNARFTGVAYHSNITTSTAFRSFGTVQSSLIVDTAVDRVAHKLGIAPEEIRLKNFFKTSDNVHDCDKNYVGQPLCRVRIKDDYKELMNKCDFNKRKTAIAEFNKKNRWKKKGISIIATKYGIGQKFYADMSSGSALVNINRNDGSVMINHGGVEIGQGINQKLIQLAAYELGIPMNLIYVAPTDTDAIVNAPATAASSGFDVNGGAVRDACVDLRERFLPIWEQMGHKIPSDKHPKWSEQWADLVNNAFVAGVQITSGKTHYMRKFRKDDWLKDMFTYFVYGYSCSEVELDVLTGQHKVVRSDILFDTGRSVAPAIDFGQIEGGFIQGLGYGTSEEIRYDKEGKLITDNAWTYELPCSKSIPEELNIELVKTPDSVINELAKQGMLSVGGAKATGEPSVPIGNSVFAAIRHALMAARADYGVTDWPELNAPATPQAIRNLIPIPKDAYALN